MGELLIRRREMVQAGETPQSDILYQMPNTPRIFDGTDGVDTGVALAGNYSDGTASPFTILFDGTPTNVTGDRYFYQARSTSLNKLAINASTYSNGNLYTAWFSSSTGTSGNNFTVGKPHRVSLTYSPDSGATYKITVNGTNTKTKTYSTTPSGAIIAATDTVKVCRNNSNSSASRFLGTVNAFVIYNRKLTDAEISSFLTSGSLPESA